MFPSTWPQTGRQGCGVGCRGVCLSGLASSRSCPGCGFLVHRALVSSSETLRVGRAWVGRSRWPARSAYRWGGRWRGTLSRDFYLWPVILGGLTYPSQGPLLDALSCLSPHDRQICRPGRVIIFLLPFTYRFLLLFPWASRYWTPFLPFFHYNRTASTIDTLQDTPASPRTRQE